MIAAQNALALSIALPLIGAILIRLLDKRPNAREGATIISAVATFALVASIYANSNGGFDASFTLIEPLPGIALSFASEPLGILFALIASFLWIVTSIYSIGYMRSHGEANQTRFYMFFAIAISCTLGIAFAANGITLFFFYEALTLSTFPLVAHAGHEHAKRSARVYLFLLLGTSIGLLLLALIWTYAATGTLDFTEGGVFSDEIDTVLLNTLLVLYVFGVGKAALMPFHRWLPAAMVAPTPVSALLHAVAVVKAGVFTILKIVIYLFGIDLLAELSMHQILSYAAAFTIIATGIIACRQTNLKRLLAYSTISQLSYIVLGALTATAWGAIGGGMHMLMHAFGKITLFFGAGAIMVAAHKTEVSELRGIGYRMPFTMIAFFIGSLCIVGVPPTGGMWSKWFLLQGIVQTSDWILILALIAGPMLSVGYLMPICIRAFFPAPSETCAISEAPWAIRIAMATSAAGCIFLFFDSEFALDLLNTALR